MKIEVVGLLFSFYSLTSATWWFNFGPTTKAPGPTKPYQRDCTWLDWTPTGLCLEVNRSFKYGREERRGQIEAIGGGKPCQGAGIRITECTPDAYYGHLFQRTVAAVASGGGTSRRTLSGSGGGTKKCSTPITDDSGTVVAAGRKCPKGRKKRRVIDNLESMKRRAKRQVPPIQSTKNRDVLFLLDESGSVGAHNYKLVIRMAKALVTSFCKSIGISKTQTRVGVLGFNREQHPAINFDEFFDKATLLDQMDKKIKYYGYPSAGATCLVEALDFTRKKMLVPGRGARNNIPGTERIIILITDGCANCANNQHLKANLETKGKEFTQDGVPIITFLIADKPGHCFNIMEGLSDGSQCYQLFWAKNWQVFTKRIEAIEQSPCMDAWMIGPSC